MFPCGLTGLRLINQAEKQRYRSFQASFKQGSMYPSGATEATSISRGSSSLDMLLWRTSHLPEQRFHLSFNRCDFKGIYTQALVCRRICLQTTTWFTQFCPGLALLLWQNDSVAQDTSHYFRVLGAYEKSSIFLNFSMNLLWPIKNTEASKGSLGERSKAWFISFSCPTSHFSPSSSCFLVLPNISCQYWDIIFQTHFFFPNFFGVSE